MLFQLLSLISQKGLYSVHRRRYVGSFYENMHIIIFIFVNLWPVKVTKEVYTISLNMMCHVKFKKRKKEHTALIRRGRRGASRVLHGVNKQKKKVQLKSKRADVAMTSLPTKVKSTQVASSDLCTLAPARKRCGFKLRKRQFCVDERPKWIKMCSNSL